MRNHNRKSNIEKVRVTVSNTGTDVIKVTYYSGRTRNMTINTMSESVREFITGNCNTIVKDDSDRVITTFYADRDTFEKSTELLTEQIVRRCMNTTEKTKYTFGSHKLSISYDDFKNQCGKLYFTIGYNKAIALNHFGDWSYEKAREVRDRIITNFRG